MSQATGWINDPQAVRDYLDARTAAGAPAGIMAARPDLKGFWKQTVESGVFAVLLYQAEESLLGEYLPADFQKRGTCVSRSTYRAIQTGYWDAIADRRISGKAERIAYEPIYGGSRVNIGKGAMGTAHRWGCNCRTGCGDGSVGAWAARWVHDYGVVTRGVFGSIDLTKDREELALTWGNAGKGVPNEIIEAAADHRCDAYHVEDATDLADVTAARYASAICSTHQQSDRRDENGECGYKGPTAHCEAIVGVYMRPTWNGSPSTIYENTGFVDQQSWGNIPSGPDVLRFYRGDAKLREGAYGTTMQAMRARIKTGETWAFRLRDGFTKSLRMGDVTR